MRWVLTFVVVLFTVGCATVPANSPQLNQKVSEGISRLKHEHLETLEKVYELSISKVNADYDKIFSKAVEIFKEKNGQEPSSKEEFKIVSIIAASIRDRILKRLRDNHDEVEKEIIKNYELVSGVNDEVTLYLHSAARFAQARKETVDLINKITGVDLDLSKHLLDLDVKLETLVKEELAK